MTKVCAILICVRRWQRESFWKSSSFIHCWITRTYLEPHRTIERIWTSLNFHITPLHHKRDFFLWKQKPKCLIGKDRRAHTDVQSVMVTLINEDIAPEQWMKICLRYWYVFMKSGKSPDFYIVHPTSCTISLALSKYSNLSVCWLGRIVKIFPNSVFPSHFSRRRFHVCLCEWKMFSLQWKSAFPRWTFKNGWKAGRNPHRQPIGHQHSRNLFIIQLRYNQHLNVWDSKTVWCWIASCIRMKVHFRYLITLDDSMKKTVCIWVRSPSVDVCVCICSSGVV